MKRIYITGICGLLGNGIVKELSNKYDICGVDLSDIPQKECRIERFDLLNNELLKQSIYNFEPDVIIHTAAAVNVDRCEEENDYAYKLNVQLTEEIVKICKNKKIRLIYISTDAVYDGKKNSLYTEEDIPNPINYYGVTKLKGENFVKILEDSLILRTNIYGLNIQDKQSFGEWIVSSLKKNQEIDMFADIFFSPILVNELAQIIDKCIENKICGLYNACGTGSISKYNFGKLVKEIFKINTGKINKTTSDGAKFKAKRSKNMGMSNENLKKILGIDISTPEKSIFDFKKLYEEQGE